MHEASSAQTLRGEQFIDTELRAYAAARPVPSLSWCLVIDGELRGGGGCGSRTPGLAGEAGPDTVYRIASMTKSFTAAAVLMLRDAGLLQLDDPVAIHLPELALPERPDWPAPTLRHLLTMSSGLPDDDPWADRRLDETADDLMAFVRGGLPFLTAPGIAFAYSNLGYALLGQVVERLARMPLSRFVETRLFEAIGLASTTMDPAAVPADQLAPGYVMRDGNWIPEQVQGAGAFAPAAGAFSSARDVARWMMALCADEGDRERTGLESLAVSSAREMQQLHRLTPAVLDGAWLSGTSIMRAEGYGLGLRVHEDRSVGTLVGHRGGLPGYGSAMVWHPESRTGLAVLTNARYGGPYELAASLVRHIVGARDSARPRSIPDAVSVARDGVERLVRAWDDGLAGDLFAPNVALDEPLDRRAAELDRLRARHGALTPDDTLPAVSIGVHDLTWFLAGDRGRVRVDAALSPERPPRLQLLRFTSVPDPPVVLAEAAGRLVAAATSIDATGIRTQSSISGWDEALASVRTAAAGRPIACGPAVAGDGATWATIALPTGRLVLGCTLRADPATGVVNAIQVHDIDLARD
jgi:CubicO group peptidase (beta-lactamase class C family)